MLAIQVTLRHDLREISLFRLLRDSLLVVTWSSFELYGFFWALNVIVGLFSRIWSGQQSRHFHRDWSIIVFHLSAFNSRWYGLWSQLESSLLQNERWGHRHSNWFVLCMVAQSGNARAVMQNRLVNWKIRFDSTNRLTDIHRCVHPLETSRNKTGLSSL